MHIYVDTDFITIYFCISLIWVKYMLVFYCFSTYPHVWDQVIGVWSCHESSLGGLTVRYEEHPRHDRVAIASVPHAWNVESFCNV